MSSSALKKQIFLVEDEPAIAGVLSDYLSQAGFAVSHFADGTPVLAAIKAKEPALVLLDIMLPGVDGLTLCRHIRQFSQLPIIMVTARVEELDKILALDIGADDYVCKPFSPREVVARVKAQLRRTQFNLGADAPGEALFQDEKNAQRIKVHGDVLELTGVEYRLLSVLIAHPGVIFSRNQLLEKIHADDCDAYDRVIDTHIKNLRRKIAVKLPDQAVLHSVYGAGYRFEL